MRIMVRVRLADDAIGQLPKEIHIPLVVFRGALDTNGFWADAACYQVPVSVDTMYTIRVVDGELLFKYHSLVCGDVFIGQLSGFEVTQHNVTPLNNSQAKMEMFGCGLSPEQWYDHAAGSVRQLLKRNWFIDGYFSGNKKYPNYCIPHILHVLLCALDKHTQSETTGATP